MRSVTRDLYAVWQFAKRNFLLYFRDRMTVFLSVLSPLIVLLLYVFFLGDLQVDAVKSAIPTGFSVDDSVITAFVDSWLIAGIMCVSCLTVALNSMAVMIRDRERSTYKDLVSAPVKPSVLTLGYFLSFWVTTFVICFGVLLIGVAYLATRGAFFLTAGDFFECVGILVVSVTNSTLVMMLIMSLIKSTSASGAFSGIFSAVIGFLVGAYMPISTFPKAIRYISAVIPGSSIGGLFRTALMRGTLQELSQGMPDAFSEGMRTSFSMQLDFFDLTLKTDFMWIYLAVGAVVFFGLNVLVGALKRRRSGL
ncbi:MAG: ABC transporter permease [Clostridia bacterium]|nr:ABC transporter permease [Clostridia bacterium]